MTAANSSAALSLEAVRVARGEAVAVDAITLTVSAGERVFLLGPNGAGKTSLLLALVGAIPFSGTIRVGQTVLSRATLADVRRDVAFVFADPGDQFFLDDVRAEVAFGPRERGLDEEAVNTRVRRALEAVDLTRHDARAPGALSLGEQRRLALATALAIEPRLLLVDEPTAALDPRARRAVLDVIGALSSTVVVATHDLDAALDLGGRVVLLREGRVIADGPAGRLLTDEALLDSAGLALPLSVAARR